MWRHGTPGAFAAVRGLLREAARMTWEQITAMASIASAIILAVGAFAAIVQLRHARLANQLEGYLSLFAAFASPEMVEARQFVTSLEVRSVEAASKEIEQGLDPRISRMGNYLQEVGSLIRARVLERHLFVPIIGNCQDIWPKLAPYATVLRRSSGAPIWADVQYLAFVITKEDLNQSFKRAFPRAFRELLDRDLQPDQTEMR